MKITIKKMVENGEFDKDILIALAKGMTYKEINFYTGLKKKLHSLCNKFIAQKI